MLSLNARAFIACVTLLPPALFVYVWQKSPALSLTWYLLFALTYAWLLTKFIFPATFSPLNHLPYPSGDSFAFGHTKVLLNERHGSRFLHWMETIPNDGLIHFTTVFHAKHRLLITTPENVQEVFTTHPYDYEKEDRARKFLARVLGRGLVVVEGKEHKMQRKSVAPAFNGKHIRDLVPLFWKKAVEFTNAITLEMVGERDPVSELKTGVIEISTVASRITLDIIGFAGLGKDFNTIVNSGDELARQYDTLTNPKRSNIVLLFVVNMFIPPSVLRLIPWKAQRVIREAATNLRRICGQLVQEKKLEILKKPSQQVDILSVLMKNRSFDDEGYVNQLLTFLAAGHETTSSALTWALWLLSIHPAIQERLRAEVLKFIPRSDSNVSLDAATLDKMEYLTAVCNEVLRLYPTIPNTAREAMRDTVIGNQKIPKGTVVVISPWSINRLTKIWGPDATEFNPDRWFGENQPANGNPYNFVTFIHGPRSCIGQGFARTELKCLLAATVRRFQVDMANPDQVVVPHGSISIKPKGGMELRMSELTNH